MVLISGLNFSELCSKFLNSLQPGFSFIFLPMKGGIGHISFKKSLVVPQRLRNKFGILVLSDILNYPKKGSLAKNNFRLVAAQKERSVLKIQMLFSWFSCDSDP